MKYNLVAKLLKKSGIIPGVYSRGVFESYITEFSRLLMITHCSKMPSSILCVF